MKTMIGAAALAITIAMGAVAQDVQDRRSILKEFENAFVELSEDVRPSVVEISAEGIVPSQNREETDPFFRFFNRPRPEGDDTPAPPRPAPRPAPTATASGFIYDTQGHIVTNNHVVEDASRLTVTLWDGEEREAVVVGQDPGADLAVIKIDPTGLDLKPVRLGDADTLKVGQFAIAMGSPNGLTGSFSYGHITGLGRERLDLPDPKLRFQSFIQTDAAINLGNSGGPLCNIDGEVIGVNVAIVFRANSIGFAIPVDRVKDVVPQLIASGKVVRGWLGVSILDLKMAAAGAEQDLEDYLDAYDLPDDSGTFVQGLSPDGPAERAGLLEDDVIRKIDDMHVEDPTHLINTISDMSPGVTATIGVWRKGKAVDIKVVIGEFPGLVAAQFGRDYFGMHVTDLDLGPDELESLGLQDEPTNYVIVEVIEDSPADEAGVRRGDVVLEIAHKDTTDLQDFKRVLEQEGRPGKTLLMRVLNLRQGANERKVYVKIPDDYELN